MSAIPRALTALADATRKALPDVQVFDGPPTDSPEPDLILIGFNPTGPAVEANEEPAGLNDELETFDVRCIASSWSGDTDVVTRRARAHDLVEAVAAALRADPKLGGAITRARVSVVSVDQSVVNEGLDCTIGFTVHVNAFAS